ncbi:MAG: DinB family protein [Rhodospirillaceae bacterium]
MTPGDRWRRELEAARGPVDAWIEGIPAEAWLVTRSGTWSRKDLLGHLTAWSDLLLDQAEALRDNRPDAVGLVDVNAWNALEIARRRAWPVEAIIEGWRRSALRADRLLAAVPPEAWAGRWNVAWSLEPVSIDDVLRLMVVHIGQHGPALSNDT